jgi:hypothetical protein
MNFPRGIKMACPVEDPGGKMQGQKEIRSLETLPTVAPRVFRENSWLRYSVFGFSSWDLSALNIQPLLSLGRTPVAPKDNSKQHHTELKTYEAGTEFGSDPIPGSTVTIAKRTSNMSKRASGAQRSVEREGVFELFPIPPAFICPALLALAPAWSIWSKART